MKRIKTEAPAVLKTAEQLYAATFSKMVEKAITYARDNGIEVNNYPVSYIALDDNCIYLMHVNEYGSLWTVCRLMYCANQVFSAREIKKLERHNMYSPDYWE